MLRARVANVECDVYIPSQKLAIEVDGRRWHEGKEEKDLRKNLRLLGAGVRVVRLRESGLRKISRIDVEFGKKEPFPSILARVAPILLRLFPQKSARARLAKYLSEGGLKNDRLFRRLLDRLPRPLQGRSLATRFPGVSREWHFERNAPLLPADVSPGSTQKVWWQCPRNLAHVYLKAVGPRTHGIGCPYCSGKITERGKDLQSLHPRLAQEWDHEKNPGLAPEAVLPGSNRKVAWRCLKRTDHRWLATVYSRVKGSTCPYCAGKRAGGGNTLGDRYPRLALEWHPEKNGALNPADVTPGSERAVFWICSEKHVWKAVIYNRTKAYRPSGCPICAGEKRRHSLRSYFRRLRLKRRT